MRTKIAIVALVVACAHGARADEARYPETLEGLKAQFDELVAAQKSGDAKKASELAARIAIPDHDAWFRKTFGEDRGALLASDYAEVKEKLSGEIAKVVERCVAAGKTSIYVKKVENPTDLGASEREVAVLSLMKERAPLWLVGFAEPGKEKGVGISPFVYKDGAFHLLTIRKSRFPAKDSEPPPAAPAHPDVAVVKAAVVDALEAARAKDDEKLIAATRAFALPEAAAWFAKTFGPEAGARVAKDYDEKAVGPELAKLFRDLAAKNRTVVEVERFEKEDPRATGLQNRALAAMKEKTALFSARFRTPEEGVGLHLWSFALVDGKVRFVGKLRGVE